MLPPPPPRHPSSRSSAAPPASSSPTSSRLLAPQTQPSTAQAHSDTPTTPTLLTPTTPLGLPPPPQHPTSRSPSPAPASRPPSPPTTSTALPPPRHPDLPPSDAPPPAVQAKLEELEDQEIHDLLERVGGQLTELRVVADDEDDEDEVIWPEKEAFRLQDGKVDWFSYGIACLLTWSTSVVPASLLVPPPSEHFSLRQFRSSLERLYVLFPPSVLQHFLLVTLPHIYRWEDPLLTSSYLFAYVLLLATDLLPAVPFGILAYHLLSARLHPPSPTELIKQAEERRAHTKEAAELGKQLQTSSKVGFGIAGEGVKGLWSEVKERVSGGGKDDDERSIKSGLAGGILLGGIAGLPKEAAEKLRQRRRGEGSMSSTASSPLASPVIAYPSIADLPPPPVVEEPARGISGKSADVSLYRLVRTMARMYGPQLQLWLNEIVELGEGVKNVLQHPTHPASLPVLLRLLALLLVLLITPAWMQIKGAWAYAGLEFFVLWRAREIWPEYRRALMPASWLLLSAPTDAEYALWLLKQRSKEGRPLRGQKTIKRSSKERERREGREGGVREKIGRHLPRSASSPSTLSSSAGTEEAILGTYFALHASTPGNLLLTSTTLSFRPTRKLRHLGKLASRLSSSSSSSGATPDDLSEASISTFGTAGTGGTTESAYVAGSRAGVELRVDEVRAVRKEKKWMGASEGLVVTTKEGVVYRYENVSKRDECLMKLLSVSAAKWETA
ncbi:hypothetical protein JCM8097_004577 [Rhodosporidiobolus ruineniae]